MDNYIKTLTLSNNERVFYCTDIHGCYSLLESHLLDVGFSSSDTLIVGGDSIDRGLDSNLALEWLDKPNVHLIKANHEELFIKSFEEGWQGRYTDCFISNGGYWVASLGADERREFYDFFTSLPTALKLELNKETVGIVHADCGNDWEQFEYEIASGCDEAYQKAIWSRTRYDKKDNTVVSGVDRVLVGHYPTDSGCVEVLGNVHYCDIGAVYRGKLAFIQLQ